MTTVLLVDDEKSVLDSLKRPLRDCYGHGVTFETAEGVSEACEVLEELRDEACRWTWWSRTG